MPSLNSTSSTKIIPVPAKATLARTALVSAGTTPLISDLVQEPIAGYAVESQSVHAPVEAICLCKRIPPEPENEMFFIHIDI